MVDKLKPTFAERADAPILAFDDVPFYAVTTVAGSITLTLSTLLALPGPNCEPKLREALVGYLKTDVGGAKALRKQLDKAILAATPAEKTRN